MNVIVIEANPSKSVTSLKLNHLNACDILSIAFGKLLRFVEGQSMPRGRAFCGVLTSFTIHGDIVHVTENLGLR